MVTNRSTTSSILSLKGLMILALWKQREDGYTVPAAPLRGQRFVLASVDPQRRLSPPPPGGAFHHLRT